MAIAGGHHPALGNGGGARSLPATARATIGSVGWPGGSTASDIDTTTLCASSASAVRAASGGACLGAAVVGAPALRQPRLRR
jgi:hypothetical protein